MKQWIAIEAGIYRRGGVAIVQVSKGSGTARRLERSDPFPWPSTSLAKLRAWKHRAQARLEDRPIVVSGTLAQDRVTYLRDAAISAKVRQQRDPQLAWWCAQPVPVGAPVLSPATVKEQAARGVVSKALTLGDLPRASLNPKRLRECLRVAFAPDDPDDPTQYASTSNSYRTALFHLSSELDQDDSDARNPLEKVKVRPGRAAQPSGQDARIVAEILRHVPSVYGPSSATTERRLAVLAWVHITPTQLIAIEAADFHDQPSATLEDIIAGAITLTKQPRLKGRKDKPIPAPETIPLNPWGVEAVRALVSDPEGLGFFHMEHLNKVVKRAAERAQVSLAAKGVTVDLSGFTLRHLKHSLAGTASLASGGLVDRQGVIRQSKGVQRALDHAHTKTTTIYTQAAVDPIVRAVNAATSEYLARLFKVPLTAPSLRLVGSK